MAGSQAATHPRRALVVAYCFPPHAAIGTHRTLRLVSHLVDRGWDVDVLTADAASYLPGTPVDNDLLARVPAGARVLRTSALRGFTRMGRMVNRVRRRPGSQTPNALPAAAAEQSKVAPPGLLRRAKALAEELAAMPDKEVGWVGPAALRGWRAFSATPPDVIFSSAPPWSTHLVAHALADAFGCRWVADFRDPWVRSPWTRYKSGPALAVARRLEVRVVRRADAVVFATETARREFATQYGSPLADRFHVVFNGCDPTEFRDGPLRAGDAHITLLHAGTLYGGRSPVPLIRAIAAVCARDPSLATRLRVKFLGATGFPGTDVSRLCAESGISGVLELSARVSREVSLEQMRQASGLLILQGGTSMAIPGKLYEYLAAGRPIFAVCEEGEMADLIRSNRLGIAASSASEADIADGLSRFLASTPESWSRAHPSLFDGRLRAAELAAILESVLPVTERADLGVAATMRSGRA